MEVPPATENPPVNNPQVSQPINPAVPASQPPAAQATTPPTNVAQSPPVSQPPSTVSAVISEPKSSKFKLFLIISIVLIVLIWGTVAYLYFRS